MRYETYLRVDGFASAAVGAGLVVIGAMTGPEGYWATLVPVTIALALILGFVYRPAALRRRLRSPRAVARRPGPPAWRFLGLIAALCLWSVGLTEGGGPGPALAVCFGPLLLGAGAWGALRFAPLTRREAPDIYVQDCFGVFPRAVIVHRQAA